MKQIYIIYFFILFSNSIFSQYTYVPDDNFEQLLIDLSFDFGPLDDYVPTANLLAQEEDLTIESNNISDLTGLEGFTNITALIIKDNPISVIDLSGNTSLLSLELSNLNITQVDLSNNPSIIELILTNNNLTTIDLSPLPNLMYLNLEGNSFSALDLSSKTDLIEINVANNQLTSLDVKNGNNGIITAFDATNNVDLSCVTIDDETLAIAGLGTYTSWLIDATAHYAENCSTLANSSYLLNDSLITIYPNPLKNNEVLHFKNSNENFIFSLYDVTGKLIDKREITSQNYYISNLAMGVYFYKIQYNSTTIGDKLVVLSN